MRIIRYALLATAFLVIVALSVANRHVVVVYAAPDLTAYGAPPAPFYDVPLFAVALACTALGFLFGALREYLRETRYRRQMSARGREIGELRREVESLRDAQKLDEDDEIIALTSR